MQIKGGYLVGTKSCRMHPIKNIKIKNSSKWTRISINANNNIISIGNIGVDINITMSTNDDDKITLLVNNKELYSQGSLFEYEVNVDCEDSNLVQYSDDNIYDG